MQSVVSRISDDAPSTAESSPEAFNAPFMDGCRHVPPELLTSTRVPKAEHNSVLTFVANVKHRFCQ